MNEEDFAELAAGHALHALSDADERRFHAALAAHPEWAARAEADAETAAGLADALAPVAPPAFVKDRLMAAISDAEAAATPDAEPRVPEAAGSDATASDASAPSPGVAEAPARRRSLFTLAASVVLLLVLGVGAALVIPTMLRPAAVTALEQIREADDSQQASIDLPDGGRATAHWSAQRGEVVLVTEGLSEPAAGKTYELWFVRGDAPVPAGTFRPVEGEATALLSGDMQAGDVIAVTVEPDGGSPTGQPTSDPVIVIPTA